MRVGRQCRRAFLLFCHKLMRKLWPKGQPKGANMSGKLLLIILDGVPLRNFTRLFGNLEGWVEAGVAQRFVHRAPLPSISASCYATIHSGLPPQVHGCTGNGNVFHLGVPDIFSQARQAGKVTGAVAHSFWSTFFNRAPFDVVRDIEYDEPDSASINHGRFHTMTGYGADNQMTPCDLDLFASLTNLCARFDLDYGLLHTCTLDSMGHRFFHESQQMDHACFVMDEMLAPFILRWQKMGYEVIVTADHGQDDRGHHGGRGDLQQLTALYYFGPAKGPAQDSEIAQIQLAPTILSRLGAPIADGMQGEVFLRD